MEEKVASPRPEPGQGSAADHPRNPGLRAHLGGAPLPAPRAPCLHGTKYTQLSVQLVPASTWRLCRSPSPAALCAASPRFVLSLPSQTPLEPHGQLFAKNLRVPGCWPGVCRAGPIGGSAPCPGPAQTNDQQTSKAGPLPRPLEFLGISSWKLVHCHKWKACIFALTTDNLKNK